jgi:hypothetical protein
MPEGTKVARCVNNLTQKGVQKPNAIRICQKSTGQAYATGKPPKKEGETKK